MNLRIQILFFAQFFAILKTPISVFGVRVARTQLLLLSLLLLLFLLTKFTCKKS